MGSFLWFKGQVQGDLIPLNFHYITFVKLSIFAGKRTLSVFTKLNFKRHIMEHVRGMLRKIYIYIYIFDHLMFAIWGLVGFVDAILGAMTAVQLYFQKHYSQTHMSSGQPKFCLLVSSKHLRCPENIHKPVRTTVLFSVPVLHIVSARHQPFIHISPTQFVLSLWLVLWFVPTFKGNYFSCAPPLSDYSRENCVRSNNVCTDSCCAAELHIICLLKFDLPWDTYYVWQTKDMTTTNKEKVV